MRHSLKNLVVLVFLLCAADSSAQEVSTFDRSGITIINGNTSIVTGGKVTDFDAGPVVGEMLNSHYFPGLQDYGNGRYDYAEYQMTFVISRARYLDQNPRRGEYLSMATYVRGMIFFYHASGVARFRLARADFESAIEWNPMNFRAYLELSRVYSELGLKDPAVSIIRRLLALNPDKSTAEQARMELKKLGIDPKQ